MNNHTATAMMVVGILLLKSLYWMGSLLLLVNGTSLLRELVSTSSSPVSCGRRVESVGAGDELSTLLSDKSCNVNEFEESWEQSIVKGTFMMCLLLVKYISGALTKGSNSERTTCEAFRAPDNPFLPATKTKIKHGVMATTRVKARLRAGATVQFKNPSETICPLSVHTIPAD